MGAVAFLTGSFRATRELTLRLCNHLSVEDMMLMASEDVSPAKWHLAHTSWFFETFLLLPFLRGYRVFDEKFHYLFNSYYKTAGEHLPRPDRRLLSRPELETVLQYRAKVDDGILTLLGILPAEEAAEHEILSRLELGIHHEQQHQELLLTDMLLNFFRHPLQPPVLTAEIPAIPVRAEGGFTAHQASLAEVGCREGFCFDNELPRHKVWLEDFLIADKLVSNDEYLQFIEDGGYGHSSLWLSDGWDEMMREKRSAPVYWHRADGEWREFTLNGWKPLDPHAPVSHVNFYEAEAFARYRGCRLPTEEEWEAATEMAPSADPLPPVLSGRYPDARPLLRRWQWTVSAYLPFPGYRPLAGSLGEYNGKFMNNQRVLRGGSSFTPANHLRASYRNYFPPEKTWQNTGIRLAKEAL